MRRIPLGLIAALILARSIGCQTIGSALPQALPWIPSSPAPSSYAEQMREVVTAMPGWVKGIVQCFAPLRALGLDRETARDCRPKALHRDGWRILGRLRVISPPAEARDSHDRLIAGLDELLKIVEQRGDQSGTTSQQQLQAVGALGRVVKALEEISGFIGPAEGE